MLVWIFLLSLTQIPSFSCRTTSLDAVHVETERTIGFSICGSQEAMVCVLLASIDYKIKNFALGTQNGFDF